MWPVYALVAAVKSLVEAIKTTVDTNLNATISSRQASWGAVAGTKTNVDNTVVNVGSNADAFSLTGSLHAKLKYLFENQLMFKNAKFFTAHATSPVSAGTWTTVHTVTGKGMAILTVRGTSGNVELTVDGVLVFNNLSVYGPAMYGVGGAGLEANKWVDLNPNDNSGSTGGHGFPFKTGFTYKIKAGTQFAYTASSVAWVEQ